MNTELGGTQVSLFSNDPLTTEASITRALIVREPWAGMIVSGTKTWEIRGSNTNVSGFIAIIAGGTGTIVGVCELVGVRGPLSVVEYMDSYRQWGATVTPNLSLPYKKTYGWVMANPRRLSCPVAYDHPNGAVIWVKLQKKSQEELRIALKREYE